MEKRVKKGQQVFIATRRRPNMMFDTGEFVKRTKNYIVVKDYETGEQIKYDNSVFKIRKVV